MLRLGEPDFAPLFAKPSEKDRELYFRYSAGLATSPRKPCSAATTCAPSPIAPPTRLTEPERTSPTANTPGTEVSRVETGLPRLSSDCAPVTTKPPRSSVTPQPPSQEVAGSAPTNRKRLRMSELYSSGERRLLKRTRASVSAPSIATISVLNISSIFGVSSIRSIGYRYMLAPRLPPRITMVTFRAWPDRNTSAWPAELPAPTSMTSCSAQSRASTGEAQYHTPRP